MPTRPQFEGQHEAQGGTYRTNCCPWTWRAHPQHLDEHSRLVVRVGCQCLSLLYWDSGVGSINTATCGQSGNVLIGAVYHLLEVKDVELLLARLIVVIIVTLLVLQKDNHVINHCDELVHADLLALERQGD